jgi:hypothetical protein
MTTFSQPQPRHNATSASHIDIHNARQRIVWLARVGGLSRRQIAARAGVAPSTISRVASGQIDQLSKATAKAVLNVKLW